MTPRLAGSWPAVWGGVLPLDAVYEILLHLLAMELCRLRVVCRRWRSLLSDSHFIAAHATRHPGPHIVAGYYTDHWDDHILCDIMDLSGSVIKRVYRTWDKKERMMSTHRDLICTTKGGIFLDIRRFRLLNPANGAVYALPEGNAHELDIGNYNTTLVFGQVATTREYKVLRLLKSCFLVLGQEQTQLCEVFTLDGCIGARWKRKKACLFRFDRLSYVVVNGIVYFFLDEDFQEQDVACKCIVSFDLGTEEWRVTHRGPLITLVGNAVDIPDSHIGYHKISMADLNGCLVVVHCNLSSMDLWYLMDFQKSLWVKKHSIQVNLSFQPHEFEVQPLLVLNDGRIVTHIETKGLLRIYNPRTSTYTDVAEMEPRSGVGLYTGNLLSLASSAS